ncbi:hypothetical protein Ancab_005039 [Ancistrocladus abbreviatus]
MAKKDRSAPLQQRPPSPSSEEVESEEEEEDEEEEEEDDDEKEEGEGEEEDNSPSAPPPPPSQASSDKKALNSHKKAEPTSTPAKSVQSHQSSSSDTDSDSDSPPSLRPNANIKPISSKSMDDGGSKVKKTTSKPVVLASAAKIPAASASKRPVDSDKAEAGSKESKRARKDKGGGEEEETGEKKTAGDELKKQLFQRVWSEDDEIAVLKGMIEYSEKKGTDPMSDTADFADFVKKSLHVDLDKKQIVDKLRRLRKKYENNLVKKKTLTPHEKNAFELSKKIWGNSELSTRMVSPKRNGVVVAAEQKELGNDGEGKLAMDVNVGSGLTAMGLDENIIKEGLKLLDSNKRAELEEKWRMLRVDEVEVYLKRVNLIREQTLLILDAMRSAKH